LACVINEGGFRTCALLMLLLPEESQRAARRLGQVIDQSLAILIACQYCGVQHSECGYSLQETAGWFLSFPSVSPEPVAVK
jgi:hypothetical protein